MNPIPYSTFSPVEAQACGWFAHLLSNRHTQKDIDKYKAWREKDEAHDRAHRKMEQLWAITGTYANRPEIIEAINCARREAGLPARP